MLNFSTIRGSAKSIQMALKGFKKVPLRDTRGILNTTNNFKWVKSADGVTTTVLPRTGTTIQEFANSWDGISYSSKRILQPLKDSAGKYKITEMWYCPQKDRLSSSFTQYIGDKKYKPIDNSANYIMEMQNWFPQRLRNLISARDAAKTKTAAEELTKQRLGFIEFFNKNFVRNTVRGEDGTVTKFISRRSDGQTLKWWRKNASGEVTTGQINKIELPNMTEKQIKITTPDKIAYKVSSRTTLGTDSNLAQSKKIVVNKADLAEDPFAKAFMNEGLDLQMRLNRWI